MIKTQLINYLTTLLVNGFAEEFSTRRTISGIYETAASFY